GACGPADVDSLGVGAGPFGEHDRDIGRRRSSNRHGPLDQDEVDRRHVKLLLAGRHILNLKPAVVPRDDGPSGRLQPDRDAADAGAFFGVDDDAVNRARWLRGQCEPEHPTQLTHQTYWTSWTHQTYQTYQTCLTYETHSAYLAGIEVYATTSIFH